MSEVDRIKNENWLNDNFFIEETKNDFQVSTERKELWAVLLDLLREFQKVCKKYDLQYFAICGTLLGAVRHNGFIPWDDDIDVAMPRDDYERLKTLTGQFNHPYSLVWPENEKENGYSFLKLRNSNTTGLAKAFSNLKINHGLFLDIFPLDDANVSSYQPDQAKIKELILQNSQVMKDICQAPKSISKERIDSIPVTFDKIEYIAKKDNKQSYNHCALRTISFYKPEKQIWNKELFKDYLEVDFEELKIRIPIGWREILETNYGDWEKFPPLSDRGVWHSSVIFNPHISYKDYLTKKV